MFGQSATWLGSNLTSNHFSSQLACDLGFAPGIFAEPCPNVQVKSTHQAFRVTIGSVSLTALLLGGCPKSISRLFQ